MDELSARLMARVAVAEDGSGCWRWQGAHSSKGYGQIAIRRRKHGVHRVAYQVWVGPIPDGLEIDHVASRGCRWRDCLNPQHLEAVTHAENLRRRVNAHHTPVRQAAEEPREARELPLECRRGHPLVEANIIWRKGKSPDAPVVRCRTCAEESRVLWRLRQGAGSSTPERPLLTLAKAGSRRKSAEERLWSKIDRTGDCWPWCGAVNGRSGAFLSPTELRGRFGRVMRPEIYAWILSGRPVPAEGAIKQACSTPRCCRPEHLVWRLGEPGLPKLNPEAVNALRARAAAGEPVKSLAAQFGISRAAAYSAIQGKSWKSNNQ